jgi:hypothetical protein
MYLHLHAGLQTAVLGVLVAAKCCTEHTDFQSLSKEARMQVVSGHFEQFLLSYFIFK